LLSAQCLISPDRYAGARGAALRARRAPTTEAPQTRGIFGAVWPAAGGDHTPLCRPALPTTAGGLYAPGSIARAAEAAAPPCPPDDPAAPCGPAASALCHGRPALGGSVHAGVSQSPGRSRSHGPHSSVVHLAARFQPALDRALAPHAGGAAS